MKRQLRHVNTCGSCAFAMFEGLPYNQTLIYCNFDNDISKESFFLSSSIEEIANTECWKSNHSVSEMTVCDEFIQSTNLQILD
mgnify:CR=1 FL=1